MSLEYLEERMSAAETFDQVPNADMFTGRVPEALVSFWQSRGLVFLKPNRVSFALPSEFDAHLQKLLSNVPYLDAFDFAAVSFDCFGMTDLWYRNSEHWIYDFQTGLLDNQTSRAQHDVMPDDLVELYAQAGVAMPSEGAQAQVKALMGQSPELTNILGDLADSESAKSYRDAAGDRLLDILESRFGTAKANEVFVSNANWNEREASTFRLLPISEALSKVPNQVLISRQEHNGEMKNETFPT